MQCPSCRKEIPDNSSNCIYCGTSVIQKKIERQSFPDSRDVNDTYERTEAAYRYNRQVNALYQDRNASRVPQPPQPPLEGRGFAKASLVLGIIGTVLFLTSWFAVLLGVTGIVFSIVSSNKGYPGRVKNAGLVLSIIATILGLILGIINL